MSEDYSESVAFQLEKEKARATRAQYSRERHTATVKKMKGMASHHTAEFYSFPSLHDTPASSAEMSMGQSPGIEAFETSFLQLQQHEAGTRTLLANAFSHDTDADTTEDGQRAVDVSLADVDTSFETVESQYSDEYAYVDAVDDYNTGMDTNVNNISCSSHKSLLDAGMNRPEEAKEGYEKDESIQCVYSTFGSTVGELFEFCIMGEVVPQKKKGTVDKARKMFFQDKSEMETNNVPPYTDSQRQAVEEMFGPASSGSRSEKEEAFRPASSGSRSEREEASSLSDSGGRGLRDESSPHRVPSYDAAQQKISEGMLAPELSSSSTRNEKKQASASSGGLKDDSSHHNVPLTPSRPVSDEECDVIDGPVMLTDRSAPKPRWKTKEPVSSQISTTPVSNVPSGILTRRERSQRAKERQRKKYGHKSVDSNDSPPESSREEQRLPTYEAPPSPGVLPHAVPEDSSPPPVHKRPQFEHFSALSSDERANDEIFESKAFDHASHPDTGKEHAFDMSASNLTLDMSAIKCTSSDDKTESRSVSISTLHVKSVSRVVADMVPETPRTTNRGSTASHKSSSGRWISPDGKWISPGEAKPAPQKSRGVVTERNFEPGTARKELFGSLDHVATKEALPPVGPQDASPPPAHKCPQWEHFSALSSDGIASHLTLDMSAIKCTNSDDETEPHSFSISSSPVKIVSNVDIDMDPETPRTTNRSFTASQKSGGRWISPIVLTKSEHPITEAAPQKSHGAATERNIEPGAARKQLFGAPDQLEEITNTSHATDITEQYLDAVRTSSFSFESPLRKSATEAIHATSGIFKSQPAHDDTMTTANTEEDSRVLDFDLSNDWEMFPNEFAEPSAF